MDTTIFLLRAILSLQCCNDNTAYMNGASSRTGAARWRCSLMSRNLADAAEAKPPQLPCNWFLSAQGGV
jgi:hypothetical protein